MADKVQLYQSLWKVAVIHLIAAAALAHSGSGGQQWPLQGSSGPSRRVAAPPGQRNVMVLYGMETAFVMRAETALRLTRLIILTDFLIDNE